MSRIITRLTRSHLGHIFRTQTSRYGKRQTRVSLSVELTSGAYPPSHPSFEPDHSVWKAYVLSVRHQLQHRLVRITELNLCRCCPQWHQQCSTHFDGNTVFVPLTTIECFPLNWIFSTRLGECPYLPYFVCDDYPVRFHTS